ncbi:SHC-transforming protein 1-like isoform X1 [Hypanus sabinus]|uniref:SHC-transforming protein 1-like isoform X1 n=1 Tax=Hypanus sabinus TaxID=79690 RepID=UPI0028C4D79E|nr:SHC-transforming protein 1-like isoform X1 [Hypanus sabinus]
MAHLKLSGPADLLVLKCFPRATKNVPRMKVSNTVSSPSLSPFSALGLTNYLCAPPQPKNDDKVSRMQPERERLDRAQWVCGADAGKVSQQPQEDDLDSGVLYSVRYLGCVEVLQSMRSLDFNTRTQVTREAINRVCEAVLGDKAALRKRKPPSKELSTILGKSNLQFAGLRTIMSISTSSLSLMLPDSKQFVANHSMQSVSFASGGNPDTCNFVAYVAKDPVNQRACHILECFDDLAHCVINSIGQAFELRFKQYLKNPHPISKPHTERTAGFALWSMEGDSHNYGHNNDIPDKAASPAGLQKAEVNKDMVMQTNSNQMIEDGNISQSANSSPNAIYENYSNPQTSTFTGLGKVVSPSDLFDDPSYMNTQNIMNPHSSAMTKVPAFDAISQNSSTDKSPSAVPMPATLSSMKEQLMKEIWYCGRMSRQEAEKLLIKDGDFLVRESMTTSGQYVLTGLQGGQAKHLLLVDPEGMVRTKDHIFDSINHLISYHMDNHLPIISSGSDLFLKKPVKKDR